MDVDFLKNSIANYEGGNLHWPLNGEITKDSKNWDDFVKKVHGYAQEIIEKYHAYHKAEERSLCDEIDRFKEVKYITKLTIGLKNVAAYYNIHNQIEGLQEIEDGWAIKHLKKTVEERVAQSGLDSRIPDDTQAIGESFVSMGMRYIDSKKAKENVIDAEEWATIRTGATTEFRETFEKTHLNPSVQLPFDTVRLYLKCLDPSEKRYQLLQEIARYDGSDKLTYDEILVTLAPLISPQQCVVIPITFGAGMVTEKHISVVVIKGGTLSFFDSKGGLYWQKERKLKCGEPLKNALKALTLIAEEKNGCEHTLLTNSRQQQQDNASCVAFVCWFLKAALQEPQITQEMLEREITQEEIHQFRAELLKEIAAPPKATPKEEKKDCIVM